MIIIPLYNILMFGLFGFRSLDSSKRDVFVDVCLCAQAHENDQKNTKKA
jgi:hypothetical protein